MGAPILAIILYGMTRIAMTLLMQLREGLFAKVAMHSVRTLALKTFEHMHLLSLRYHLERRTGGLSRVIERATRADMRVLRAPLAGLAALVARHQVKSPAVIVIGEVAAEQDIELRPLALEALA